MYKICNLKSCSHKGARQCATNFYKSQLYADNREKRCKDCARKGQEKYSLKKKESRDFVNLFL
jgi:hypothetical protein